MAALIGVSVKPSGGYTCKVPLDSLSEDGTPPAEGDSVSYSVDGTVTAVSGSDATVKVTAINGEPVGGSSLGGNETEPAGDQSSADMGAALRAGAKGQPMPF